MVRLCPVIGDTMKSTIANLTGSMNHPNTRKKWKILWDYRGGGTAYSQKCILSSVGELDLFIVNMGERKVHIKHFRAEKVIS